MKSLFVLMGILLVAGPAAMASTTTCPSTTLDVYLAPGFSCVSGNLLFGNFSYTNSAAPDGTAIQSSSLFVTPLTNTLNEGFMFTAAWQVAPVAAGSFQDSKIAFTVSTSDNTATINNLSLFFNGTASGPGSSSVTEQFCLGGSVSNCSQPIGQIQVTNPPAKFNDVIFFSPVSTVGVSKDINVNSGSTGSAFISQVANRYGQTSAVPEPLSYLLVGVGLLGLGLIRKRVRS